MSTPTVSVIIPCYNLGAYLDQAVQSVLDQTYRDFEILIIDDGSTDAATRHLFASYQRPKTRIFQTKNQGLARTRNLGLNEAAGIYVSFLDADDMFEPTFLARTVETLNSEPSIAFASCWFKAFGEADFLWSPTTCDFPHLLAEDTVCTPALTRRNKLLDIGGFDADMPVAGYEDWDVAISLVERGFRGTILREPLFRYRIRAGSMSADCTSPDNHARLMQYLVDKHPDSYRRNLIGVLETIETRTQELSPEPVYSTQPQPEREIAFLQQALDWVLNSQNWRLTRPLRQAISRIKRARTRLRRKSPVPRISVVVTCRDQGRQLPGTVEDIGRVLGPGHEIVIADADSTETLTRQVLDWYEESGFKIVRTKSSSLAAAREKGLREVSAGLVFAMNVGQHLQPEGLLQMVRLLEADSSIGFVIGGLRDRNTGFTFVPASTKLEDVLSCPRSAFPVLRRDMLIHCGGYDYGLPSVQASDWDLVIRLVASGRQGTVVRDQIVDSSFDPMLPLKEIVQKHSALFDAHWKHVVVGRENLRRRHQDHLEKLNAPTPSPGPHPLNWGELRRLEPVSAVWGIDRGQPVDRYYIAQFLDEYRNDIRGRVLEVKDPHYTRIYGTQVDAIDIVDVAPDNPAATLVCDLADKDALPENIYNCFVITQTIHIIYDIREVVRNACRTLRPGGVLLATLPCVSRVDYESGLLGDCWRFTAASAKRLFEDVFGRDQVEIKVYGNVLACCGFLLGISSGELTQHELDHHDPYFPLLIGVQAVKSASDRTVEGAGDKQAARVAYTGSPQILLDELLSKEKEISSLLRANYESERHIQDWLEPESKRRQEELDLLKLKLQDAPSRQPADQFQKQWGDFLRTTPISTECGADRGRRIDRYYIDQFIEEHSAAITGDVLEVHDSGYTVRFGGDRVRRSDVVDYDRYNSGATVIADLRRAHTIPSYSYDCFILTQTLHVIFDMRAVLGECVRILKPGGVLLATLPCVKKVAHGQGLDGDFWRFTRASAEKLFGEFFDHDHLDIRVYGNVLTNIAYLYGLACRELEPRELEIHDSSYPLIIGVRAESSNGQLD